MPFKQLPCLLKQSPWLLFALLKKQLAFSSLNSIGLYIQKTVAGSALGSEKEKSQIKRVNLTLSSVGATGFEPATTWSQTRSATGLRYTPNAFSFKAGAKILRFFQLTKKKDGIFSLKPENGRTSCVKQHWQSPAPAARETAPIALQASDIRSIRCRAARRGAVRRGRCVPIPLSILLPSRWRGRRCRGGSRSTACHSRS